MALLHLNGGAWNGERQAGRFVQEKGVYKDAVPGFAVVASSCGFTVAPLALVLME